MKRGLKRGIFLTGLTFLALAMEARAAEAISLVWATDNTPGGNYIVGEGNAFQEDKPGIEIELYRMVARKLQFDLQLKRMPWKQCLQQIEFNKVDGIFPATFRPERMKIGVFPMRDGAADPSRRTRNNVYCLYKLQSSKLRWDGRQFQNLTGLIAAPAGWSVVEDMRKLGVAVKEVPMHVNSPDLLLQNRVEGFLCLETVFDSYLKGQPQKYGSIEKDSKPLWEKSYYLMLSRRLVEAHPELAQEIWDAIRDLKQSDDFARIASRYPE